MENEKETVFSVVAGVLSTITQVIEFYVMTIVGALVVHHLIKMGWIKLNIEPKILQALPAYALMVLAIGNLMRVILVPFIQIPQRIFYSIHRSYSINK